ncbi:MAG: SGNH/GDSL hydrolase family protein [Planctomycetes bacterium]|nr:SGNH/GDSL hydrolase family protein [Planctomycetota bacterium]
MPTKLKSGQTILFTGDSITDCGRREDAHKPLGCGYVRLLADMLAVLEPAKKVRVVNTGIGGNTVEDLRSRWDDDVLYHRPDWLGVMIGINDVNRHLCSQNLSFLPPKDYEEIYDQILAVTRRKLPRCRILLLEPFFASTDRVEHSYRAKVVAKLPKYIRAVGRMSKKYKTLLVRTHGLFHSHFRYQPRGTFFPSEPVHLNSTGHMLIAQAVWKILGG